MSEHAYCLEYLTVITGRKQRAALVSALSAAGGRLIKITYAKGSVKASFLQDMLGLVPEENKVIITCILPCQKVDCVLSLLVKEFHFDQPNTGIAFTIPVEKCSL